MRRRDREITDRDEIIAILDESIVCRIAFNAAPAPYVVPLNFGYEWAGPDNAAHRIVRTGVPCDWGMRFSSIIGTGRVELIGRREEKAKALDAIMRHYGYPGTPVYNEEIFDRTVTYKLVVEELTAKARR